MAEAALTLEDPTGELEVGDRIIYFSGPATTGSAFEVADSTSADTIWTTWVVEATSTNTVSLRSVSQSVGNNIATVNMPETVGSKQRLDDALEEYRKAEAERRKKLDEKIAQARERAKQLLCMLLTDEQKKSLEEHGNFIVKGKKHAYLFRAASNPNISMLNENGSSEQSGCLQTRTGSYNVYDKLVSQLLFLMANEDRFIALTNWSF